MLCAGFLVFLNILVFMKYTPQPAALSHPTPVRTSAVKPTVKPKGSANRQLPGEVRIIGGIYKRSKIAIATTSSSGAASLRPTPDRVRETLFNWLGQDLTGWHCADVFAGTGVLGFEAASRGAALVWLTEQDALLVDKLKAVQTRLGTTTVRIERGDGVSALRRTTPGSLNLVFLDPPYDAPASVLPAALKAAALAIVPTGLVYLEAPALWDDAALASLGLKVLRSSKAGNVHFHLLNSAVVSAESVQQP